MSADVIQELQPSVVALTALDRCHGCGAQAYLRVETLEMGDFLFCLHHWTVKNSQSGKSNKDVLEPLAVHVHDETDKLLPKPYDPATDND